jgi:ribosomal protein L31
MAQYSKHPKQHEVVLELSDKSKITVLSSHGKKGELVKLDQDPINHPAWRTENSNFVNPENEMVSKFKKKFSESDLL